MSDDSSDVDIIEIGGIRNDCFEDGGPGEVFDAGIEWARGAEHPGITVMPFVQEIGCRHNLAEKCYSFGCFIFIFRYQFF